MTEDPLVQKAVSMLRQARKVIELMHAEKEESFQEEPSLADLVMVAQILGQTAVAERMEESARSLVSPSPAPVHLPTAPSLEGAPPAVGGPIFEPAAPPDVVATWLVDHWGVSIGENFMWRTCSTLDELSKALLESATFAAEYRLKERSA